MSESSQVLHRRPAGLSELGLSLMLACLWLQLGATRFEESIVVFFFVAHAARGLACAILANQGTR